MCEGGLTVGQSRLKQEVVNKMGKGRTSQATPGRNIATARAWKNLRLALRLSVGTCLSAASRKSAARRDTLAPFGMLGRAGKLSIRFGKFSPPTSDPLDSDE